MSCSVSKSLTSEAAQWRSRSARISCSFIATLPPHRCADQGSNARCRLTMSFSSFFQEGSRLGCEDDALTLSRASERERGGTRRDSDGRGEGLQAPSLDHPHPVAAAARRRLPLPLQSAGEGKEAR